MSLSLHVEKKDVTDEESIKNAIKAVVDHFGKIDILVNNAGVVEYSSGLHDHTTAQWDKVLDTDLKGVFLMAREVSTIMMKQKYGRIINISSMWGQVGGSCEAAYSATKGAVIALTKALAKELGPSGIRVNCVAPGVIETDMMASFTDEDRAALAEETPVERLGTAEDVARAIVFLCDENAGYITGQVLGVNGGLVI